MSTNIYWRAAPPPPEPLGSGDHPLKDIIARLYFGQGGSLRGESTVVELNTSIASYLEGYLAGHDDEEVRQFLADLRKHKRLEVWIDD